VQVALGGHGGVPEGLLDEADGRAAIEAMAGGLLSIAPISVVTGRSRWVASRRSPEQRPEIARHAP